MYKRQESFGCLWVFGASLGPLAKKVENHRIASIYVDQFWEAVGYFFDLFWNVFSMRCLIYVFNVFLLGALDDFLYCLFYLSYLSYQGMSIFNNKTQVKMGSAFFVFLSCLYVLSLFIFLIFLILGYLDVMFLSCLVTCLMSFL